MGSKGGEKLNTVSSLPGDVPAENPAAKTPAPGFRTPRHIVENRVAQGQEDKTQQQKIPTGEVALTRCLVWIVCLGAAGFIGHIIGKELAEYLPFSPSYHANRDMEEAWSVIEERRRFDFDYIKGLDPEERFHFERAGIKRMKEREERERERNRGAGK